MTRRNIDPSQITITGHYWKEGHWTPGDHYVRTNRAYIARHPDAKVVWLEPRCSECIDGEPRCWCSDEAWETCDGANSMQKDHWGCLRRATPYREIKR